MLQKLKIRRTTTGEMRKQTHLETLLREAANMEVLWIQQCA